MQRTAPTPAIAMIMTLPEEVIIEILTWLPGKEVARCQCVCKPLQSVIRSPPFQKAYGYRNRGLIMYCCRKTMKDQHDFSNMCLSFYYSPLRRLNEPPPPEEFSPLKKVGFDSFYDGATQVVNGLVCHGGSQGGRSYDMDLTIHNVFTGEKMKVVEPEHIFAKYKYATLSSYHLGYDPVDRTYKILGLVFQLKGRRLGAAATNLPIRSFMMVLRSSSSNSRWRSMNYKDCGLADLPLSAMCVYKMVAWNEARTFPGDGVACWFSENVGLIMFNFAEEKFRYVKLPEGFKHEKRVFVRAPLNGLYVLALYVLPRDGQPKCFVLEDKEGKQWRKECVSLPEDINGRMGSLAVGDGDERVLLMDSVVGDQESSSRLVYSYGDDKSVEKFVVGKLPSKPLDLDGKCFSWNHYVKFDTRLSCLHDGNVLYQSLNDVLSGASYLEPECDRVCYYECGEGSKDDSEDEDSDGEDEDDDLDSEEDDEAD